VFCPLLVLERLPGSHSWKKSGSAIWRTAFFGTAPRGSDFLKSTDRQIEIEEEWQGLVVPQSPQQCHQNMFDAQWSRKTMALPFIIAIIS
jgi:hypothetical protein